MLEGVVSRNTPFFVKYFLPVTEEVYNLTEPEVNNCVSLTASGLDKNHLSKKGENYVKNIFELPPLVTQVDLLLVNIFSKFSS